MMNVFFSYANLTIKKGKKKQTDSYKILITLDKQRLGNDLE